MNYEEADRAFLVAAKTERHPGGNLWFNLAAIAASAFLFQLKRIADACEESNRIQDHVH